MNIKTSNNIKFKIPSIWFKTTAANFGFGTAVFGLVINYIIGLTGTDTIGLLGQSIYIVVVWAVFIGFAAGPNEAFKHRNYKDEDYERNISDAKRSITYLTIVVVSLITLYNINKPIPTPPPEDLTVQVDSIQIYEIHTNVDEFAIRYIDVNGKELFSDVYKKMEDRDDTIKRILDNQGKPKVSLIYKRIGGQRSIEIGAKPIKL